VFLFVPSVCITAESFVFSHKFDLFGVDLKHENISLVFLTDAADYIPLSVKIQMVSI
jgi:hypothetical protein